MRQAIASRSKRLEHATTRAPASLQSGQGRIPAIPLPINSAAPELARRVPQGDAEYLGEV